ncbi:MAG: hypothetical protein GF329_08195 [Candidatus Lokiarchaeota archaeon]|nr:hypothetical protein [Candidatus Lokiarchaeota archaeon]
MSEENPIIFENFELVWFFTVDLIHPIKNMPESILKISESALCEACLYYYTPEEREKGIGNVKLLCDNKDIQEEYQNLLDLFMETDFLTLDENYLEANSYSRFILKGLKIKLPNTDKFHDAQVLLNVSKLGIAIFSFWIKLKDEKINSRELANIQILPIKETRDIGAEIPIEIIEELTHLDTDYLSVYNKLKKKNKTSLLLKDTSFEEIISFYWNTLINRIFNLKFKLQDSITSNLRCESYCVFPMVILHSKKYKYADELIKENPKQIYQILSHMYNIDFDLIYENVLNDLLEPNITERRDIGYLDSLGSVLMIFGSETKNIIRKQMEYDKSIKSIEIEYKKNILESFIIIEVLQLQRQYLNLLTQILTHPIAEMSPKEISIMRTYLSKALDMYHGEMTGNSLARKRLEHGKDIMEIDESFEMVNEKMELLGNALESFNNLRTSFFEVALALIFGIIPMFYILLPFADPIFNSIAAISITVAIIFIFLILSRWYWKRTKRKEIK